MGDGDDIPAQLIFDSLGQAPDFALAIAKVGIAGKKQDTRLAALSRAGTGRLVMGAALGFPSVPISVSVFAVFFSH
jgi:hypothetical protein